MDAFLVTHPNRYINHAPASAGFTVTHPCRLQFSLSLSQLSQLTNSWGHHFPCFDNR